MSQTITLRGEAFNPRANITTSTDYANAQILVAFNAGETTKTFAIPLNPDYLIEGNETLQLSLANPTNSVTLGSQNTSTLTIVDDDTSIGFTNSAYRLNEDGTGSNVITIQRSGNLNLSTSVNFNVTGGSAINGEDYNLAANTLVTFAVGEATKTITIPVVNDNKVEGLETIKFSLSNPTNGATIDSNRQNTVGIITDDETALKFNFNVAVGTDERAVDGFIGAANIWSKLLDNPVVINADLGFSNIGTSTLAQNTAERLTVSYESFRTALAAHRFSLDDYLATGNLSKNNSFDLLINRTTNNPNGVGSLVPYLDNDGDANNQTISINRANAKALGLVNATDIGRDTQLILNSYGGLSWDFNSNDGIATNAYDFVGLATHELGHALGFDSGIDTLDNGVPKSDEANTFVTPLDLFRFSTQSVAAGKGTIDWTATNTDKYFSIDGGITSIASFATGVIHGDGKEPQHWKDNLGLGIMDPTLVRGEQLAIKPLDKQAFDVIGWNLLGTTPAVATIEFTTNSFQINEDGTSITAVTLTRSGRILGTATVNIDLTAGTATAGSDYNSQSFAVTFADGEVTKTVSIPVVDDTLIESSETINLSLSSNEVATVLGTQSTAVLTVVDNDVQLAFDWATYTVNEDGTSTIAIKVLRTGKITGEVGATIVLTNGTASDADYINTPINVVFAAGEVEKVVTVPIINDTLIETDETINLSLTNPTNGATLGTQSTAVLTVIDNDTQLAFERATYTVNEDGTSAIAIKVLRTGKAISEVGATISLANGTASNTDYINAPINVVFAAGEVEKIVTIPIINDTLIETDETINLSLTNPTNGATLGTQSTAILTVIDNDVQLAFERANYIVNEDGTNTIAIKVLRTGKTTGEVGATIVLTNGTASNADYTNTPINVVFAAGEVEKIVTVPINNDTLIESDETINLSLTSPTNGATLATQSTAVLTVVDNDVQLAFERANYTVNEDGTNTIAIKVLRTGKITGEVGATISLANGTASNTDYINTPINVVFAAGEIEKIITVPIINDTTFEPDETVNLSLTNPTNGATVGTQSSAVLTIVSDDVQGLNLIGTSQNNTLIGGAGNDFIDGREGNDTLNGNGGDDTIIGGAGNDILDGGTGADNMAGGIGNDTYYVDNLGDIVTEAVNSGTDTINASIDYTLVLNVENLNLTGTTISGTGNALNNTITGNDSDNIIDGKGGNDRLVGGKGNDTYYVDSTSDTLVEAVDAGNDTVIANLDFSLRNIANVENLTLIGTATTATGNTLGNTLTGNELDNSLYGREGDDILVGGDGNDLLDGGTGIDNLTGGSGNDTYSVDNLGDAVIETANGGIDTVNSTISYSLGDYLENLTLTGGSSLSGVGNDLDNIITGNDGSSTLSGGKGNDTLIGKRGADILDGGIGADTMEGSTGNDTYIVDNIGDVVTELVSAGNDVVKASIDYILTANVENLILENTALIGIGNELNNTLTGNESDNTLRGEAGNDTLIGNGGNDILDGVTGNDNMSGGIGNDTYYVDSTGDRVTETVDAGIDLVIASIDYSIAGNNYANVENITLVDNALRATGNLLDNTLSGNAQNNILDGREGADTMIGGLGDDTYYVDNISDVVTENANGGLDLVNASIDYTLAAEVENLTLTGTANNGTGNELNNIITGNSRNNELFGLAGDDTLIGNGGNDTLDGGTGNDNLSGGGGNDTYYVDNLGDLVTEAANSGTDTVEASINYTLTANVENLVLTVVALNGTGNDLNNIITGNAGNNILTGGRGNDTLFGGAGVDSFVLNKPSFGVDTIKDFVSGTDKISISQSEFGGGLTAGNPLLSSQIRIGAGVSSANSASQRFLFNTTNGNLYFDADGIGGVGAVQIGKLEGVSGLSTGDFHIGI
jgi:Ca2+-binding RTX toxin-like protein